MLRNKRRSGIFALILALLAASVVVAGPVQAASGSDFDPGYIMSDEVFYDASTMSAGQVQQFLDSKLARCEAGYTCLKDYTTPTTAKAAVANRCAGYTASGSETAATIIYKVSQSCGINPQVLIVLLQKEQGLVTNTAPSAGRYRSATGFGCPDTAACDSTYYGFFNQVYQAAYQFKVYKTAPSYFNFRAGRNNSIGWHPNAACGASTVYIQNQATAGLYNYTPYRPNTAALNNMYGSGDSCSSYGNRNFFAYFTDWFGAVTAGERDPVGALDALSTAPESVSIRGWALDPDSKSPIELHAYVDGVGVAILKAGDSRPDVGRHYPELGANHGFDVTIPVPAGVHTLCVYMINQGIGGNRTLVCQQVSIMSASPVGYIDSFAVQPGGVLVRGWTLDPESAQSLEVHVYVNGSAQRIVANEPRPDIERHYPGLGAAHGFTVNLPLESGSYSICAYGINVGKGSNSLLSCENATVLSGSPIGAVDEVTAIVGGVKVRGWALDPDSSDPTSVHVYVDGVGVALKANVTRSDIARAFPVYGANHGYDTTLKVGPGTHNVCVYGINTGKGSNALLSCRSVTVSGGLPFGAFDSVTSAGREVEVRGWAIDPDVVDPINVHIYIDGLGYATGAGVARPDVGRAYPQYGANHGFARTFSLSPGNHSVCIYAINNVPGDNPSLGCRTVVVG